MPKIEPPRRPPRSGENLHDSIVSLGHGGCKPTSSGDPLKDVSLKNACKKTLKCRCVKRFCTPVHHVYADVYHQVSPLELPFWWFYFQAHPNVMNKNMFPNSSSYLHLGVRPWGFQNVLCLGWHWSSTIPRPVYGITPLGFYPKIVGFERSSILCVNHVPAI